ncbi:MAG TPA: hypothetical protein VM492_02580 [Sumerlaeia bacterium]|nr:hypothetical protein [Sumerlaeia bacterium]
MRNLWRRIKDLVRRILLLDPKFLCDDCHYDYGHACRRPERPNARRCPDYKRRGG